MPSPQSKRSNLMQFLLIFAVVYLGSQLILPILFPQWFAKENGETGIVLRPLDPTVKGGHHPELILRNGTEQTLELPDRCPMPPLDVYRVEVSGEGTELATEETAIPCASIAPIEPGKQATISLAPWKYSLFGEYGDYEVRLVLKDFKDANETNQRINESTNQLAVRFSIHEPGPVTKLFRLIVTKPFLNFLIFTASFFPDRSLGIAIIILTILVKLILFLPTQHALEGQRKLQKLQPKLDELKKKYKDNPEKLNKEIMQLWKTHNVNPLQSCLPMLLQFPFLIGIFFVIRDGSVLELSRHLVYPFYQDLSWSFGTAFLGLDLLKPSIYVMPPLLFVLQFAQLKLSFSLAKKKEASASAKATADKKDGKPKGPLSPVQQEMQQKVMLYGLPVLIAVFAFQFAAAVSLYWAVSTVFGIGQQLVVNRRSG